MNVKIRNRAVGFLLLLALAGFLVSVVVQRSEPVPTRLSHVLPEPPVTEPMGSTPVVTDTEQQQLDQTIDRDREKVAGTVAHGDNGSVGEVDNRVADSSSAQRSSSTPEQPGSAQPDEAVPQAGFVVKVASFRDRDNATALVDKLRQANYHAYLHAVTVQDQQWYRVYVGPEIRRQDAQQQRSRLVQDDQFQLTPGQVQAFVP